MRTLNRGDCDEHGGNGNGGTCPCKLITRSTSIWTAAKDGDYNEVIRRVDLNPTLVNSCDKYGYSALHYAAQGNHEPIVTFLLSKGANPNANSCGVTPLIRAGNFNNCVHLLLSFQFFQLKQQPQLTVL